jgi:hypothetical protein
MKDLWSTGTDTQIMEDVWGIGTGVSKQMLAWCAHVIAAQCADGVTSEFFPILVSTPKNGMGLPDQLRIRIMEDLYSTEPEP